MGAWDVGILCHKLNKQTCILVALFQAVGATNTVVSTTCLPELGKYGKREPISEFKTFN